MISDLPKPFLFIHIPKTAGTSVETALMKELLGVATLEELDHETATRHALPGGMRLARGLPYRARTYAVQHETVAYFEDLGQLDGRHVFSVVRNPYDRALSQLIYLLRTDPLAQQVFKGPTWADDLKIYAEYDGMIGHDLAACQVDWLMDHRGELRCDRFIRFEYLSQDWQKFCEDMGLENPELPHLNNMQRKVPWWEFYDAEAADGIARKYARDFEILGYDVKLPQTCDHSLRERIAWLGGGKPPESALRFPLRTRHGRLEFPDKSLGALHLYGCLEMMDPSEAGRLLRECRRVIHPQGRIHMNTLDLEFITSLLPAGYEEGTLQHDFIRAYSNRHLPESENYSPAEVINHLIRRKGQRFLYDEALLAELLEQACLQGRRLDDGPLGEIVVEAICPSLQKHPASIE